MGELRLDLATTGQAKRLDNGFLKIPVSATRSGIFVYRDAATGEEWRELRPPEEVFKKDSLDTLKGVPVTNDHPSVMVDSMNARQFMVGYTSDNVSRDKMLIKTSATVTEQSMIDMIEAGEKREVSMGYQADIDWTPGEYRGERYDAVQRNIRYNHLAIVRRGRAGPDVKVHLDSKQPDRTTDEKSLRLDSFIELDENADNDRVSDQNDNTNDRERNDMKTIVINGVEYKVDDDAHAAITSKIKADADQIEQISSELKTVKKEKSTLEAKCDSQDEQIKELKQSDRTDEQFNQAVNDRVNLITFAGKKLDGEDLTALSNRDIIVKLIQTANPEFKADGKDDVYLAARLDHMIEIESQKTDGEQTEGQGSGGAYNNLKNDAANAAKGGSGETADQKRERLKRDQAEAWKKPIGYAVRRQKFGS